MASTRRANAAEMSAMNPLSTVFRQRKRGRPADADKREPKMMRASQQAVEVAVVPKAKATAPPAAVVSPAPTPTEPTPVVLSTSTAAPAAAADARPAAAAAAATSPRPEWVTDVVRTLRQRLVTGVPGWSAAAVTLTEDQRRLESQLVGLLTDTVVGEHCNSALLLGPRGTGKSLVLERALRTVGDAHADQLVTVRLSGLVHTDDVQALKHTAAQLCSQQKIAYSRSASFEDNMMFLHDMLKECARAHRAVVFALDEFDLLALRPKQTLLYTILNAMHSAQVQSVVLGVSSRMDAAELLEKRVLSRFSHRKLLFSSLGDGVEPALQLLRDVLRVDHPQEDPASAAKAEYVRSFNQAVDTTLASTSVKQLLELPVGLDASPRAVCDLAAAAVGHISRATGVLRPEDVQFAVTERLRGALSASLAGCSVLELWMLVAMHRLRTWRNRPVASFNEAWAECTGTVGAAANAVEAYGRVCARRAWESLLAAELMRDASKGFAAVRGSHATAAFLPARLLVPACVLTEALAKHKQVPSLLQSWLKQDVVAAGPSSLFV